MPNTQPGQPVLLHQDVTQTEATLASWTEPSAKQVVLQQLPLSYVIAATAVLTVILVFLGWLMDDFNFYGGALVMLMAGVAVTVQHRQPPRERTVIITTQNVQIGRRTYPLNTLAGFWLEQAGEVIAVNIEPKKASMLPINLLYPSVNAQEARAAFAQVMPELEPRATSTTDSLSRYIRL